FHMIRQNATTSTAVLARLLEVLTSVVSIERDENRTKVLQRHADLVIDDAGRSIHNPSDIDDLRQRHRDFEAMRLHGPVGYIGALSD
ncbi:MAG: DUF2254 domain-containing protein, partial [Pseudomonadota bacterium]|nr:DUF2254 domain-containing protein [Pseudomonadota bacterium]